MTTTARLRAFVAVADTGSVRAAAARLVLTESAVSAAIGALSDEVGVPLLERNGRGLRLTPPGETFAGYARAMLGLHDEALSAARGDLDPAHGRIRLAAVTTAADHLLPAALAGFRTRYPDVELRLDVGTSEHVWALLDRHETDLVIAGRPPRGTDDLVIRAERSNDLVAVAAPPVAATFDAGAATWLMREAGSGTRSTCEALLDGLELDPPRLTLGSNGAVVAGAVAGLGVTLVSRDAVERELAAGDLETVPLPGTPLHRPWHVVTHRRVPASVELLVAHLLAGGAWRSPDSPARSTHGGS
ncbi:DNA-binding transcriptional LysR family regulator [Saccharomonospora amisosensis]|uniref:DNA-binding transcriptional LysR family regulator n=1 Tax=Saccharomonospora amisosensis TaxID=1128677 RepID=A0A7X5URR1_9PSEU|nr:LysR family transcriptional regulator [Saccharomonospora amisosensis]NIJ12992.1 DNA-binding transcriptional LysR family regulator [Saccharomonospora amisosensis]